MHVHVCDVIEIYFGDLNLKYMLVIYTFNEQCVYYACSTVFIVVHGYKLKQKPS